ncbi:hypothetical protein PENFLA_c014G03370 [Penicillium flavigenum]|uniref:LysM domain-containing protein n=1 Tax=Penicillium flavigenum TaxID=254877 RepID=A0A1V6T6J8_9EURO|nr:hypothetical protein PENFLA_c014G03370 [Penicillium flavigenum]
MVRPSVVLPALCLSASVTATLQRKLTNGDTATGTTGGSSIETYFGITEKQFLSWNPLVPYSCTLVRGWSYCVAGPENPVTSSSTTATPTPAGTLTYSGTAAPTQSGVSSSCKKFYLVQESDTCYTIQDSFASFTLQQFYSWNLSISTGCDGLFPGYYVCVGSAAVTGHQPQQTGIPSDCNKWYWIVDGDDCATIASKHDITQQQFYECKSRYRINLHDVVVKGLSLRSSSSASTTSVSKATTAPSTTSGGAPGPTGRGTVTDCVTYYEAQSGDSCWSIVNEKYTYLTQALLTKWNPSLGDACSLLKDQYYCVAIKAAQPMPGTIDTCKTWHLVASGDGCWQIEQDNGITATQFNTWNPQVGSDCAGLWLGYYVCVGV